MNNNLVLELSKMADLTKSDLSIISPFFKTKHYKKGEYFLEEGRFCKYVGFVNEGLFNFFYLDNGVQRTRGFFFPNSFISNYSCFLENNKSKTFIQAMEDCTVTILHKDDISFLYETLPKFYELSNSILQDLYLDVSKKYESFLIDSAQDRYLELIKSRPMLIKKIPQYMIASYIGVTPEALSRIKKRILKNTS